MAGHDVSYLCAYHPKPWTSHDADDDVGSAHARHGHANTPRRDPSSPFACGFGYIKLGGPPSVAVDKKCEQAKQKDAATTSESLECSGLDRRLLCDLLSSHHHLLTFHLGITVCRLKERMQHLRGRIVLDRRSGRLDLGPRAVGESVPLSGGCGATPAKQELGADLPAWKHWSSRQWRMRAAKHW